MQIREQVGQDSVYCFLIYEHPKSGVRTLLFEGVANIRDNMPVFIHRYDYLTTSRGFKRLRNYYDMVEKFGELPCRIVDLDGAFVSDVVYEDQKEIQKTFELKSSRSFNRAFAEKDIIGSAKIMTSSKAGRPRKNKNLAA